MQVIAIAINKYERVKNKYEVQRENEYVCTGFGTVYHPKAKK